MSDLKHVGRIAATGKKCVVVFRTLPGDAFNCLIVLTESLPASYHDALINLVDSSSAQSNSELSEVLARAMFPDGSTMLPALHAKGFLVKVPTDKVEMTPNSSMNINLAELNQIIAEQRGISVQDLMPGAEIQEVATAKDISPTTTEPVADEDLSSEALAKKYRSDADRLSKEAAQLRRMAEELVPTKKKVPVSQ